MIAKNLKKLLMKKIQNQEKIRNVMYLQHLARGSSLGFQHFSNYFCRMMIHLPRICCGPFHFSLLKQTTMLSTNQAYLHQIIENLQSKPVAGSRVFAAFNWSVEKFSTPWINPWWVFSALTSSAVGKTTFSVTCKKHNWS